MAWPLSADLDEAQLEERLYGRPAGSRRSRQLEGIDFAAVHKELKARKNLTLQREWQEYREQHPDGYGYSQYCERYRQWKSRQNLVMLHEHKAGENLFVDYAGQAVPIDDAVSGELRAAVIFVAVLGASSCFFAEASWGQDVESWVNSHVRAFEYFGGVVAVLVPDNLKSGVTKACRYEPVLNRSYKELARHYGVAIVPARPYRPRDNAYVEAVRRAFLGPACVQSAFGPADERLAVGWHACRVPLETVRHAILLGCVRKSMTLIDWPTAQPVHRLRYFEPVLREVQRESFPASYWRHLEFNLGRCEDYWQRHPEAAPDRAWPKMEQAG